MTTGEPSGKSRSDHCPASSSKRWTDANEIMFRKLQKQDLNTNTLHVDPCNYSHRLPDIWREKKCYVQAKPGNCAMSGELKD